MITQEEEISHVPAFTNSISATDDPPNLANQTGSGGHNARGLHEFLGVGKDFSNWIKDRIERYGFADGEDYVTVFAKIGENHPLTGWRGLRS